MQKYYLFTPGPTQVPPKVSLQEAYPIIHHRKPEFEAMLNQIIKDLKYIFCTEQDVFILAASGTGAMEAAVVNLLSPNDEVIVVVGGKFGERWYELCKVYNIAAKVIEIEWGDSVEPEQIKKELDNNKNIKAVFTTLCETSTGALTDIKAIGEIVKNYDAVLVVDGISGVGADELRCDEWTVDVLVVGSQKGLMLPPGLAFITVSNKAYKLIEASTLPKYYFCISEYKKALKDNQTPFTPSVSLIYALSEALKMITTEGIEQVWQRHKRLSSALKTGINALNLKIFPKRPSAALTAVATVPINANQIIEEFKKKNIVVAEGQAKLKGKIFRIAHLGYYDTSDIFIVLLNLEEILYKLGYKEFRIGDGIKACQEDLILS